MIIIEGADGSGKTTFANMIMAAFPRFKKVHSPGPLNAANVKERIFWNNELTSMDYVIMDRCTMFSERVYGPVLRNNCFIDIQQFSSFLTNVRNGNKRNMIVFCDREFNPIKKEHGSIHLNKKEKMKLEDSIDENLSEIREAYRDIFNSLFKAHQSLNSFIIKNVNDEINVIDFIRRNYEH